MTTQTIEIPDYCGPLSDLNRSQECKRAGGVYAVRQWRNSIDVEIGRLSKLRGKYADRRRANLQAWIDREEALFARHAPRMVAELPECTHSEHDRRVITSTEDAMPDCTCG